MNFAGVSKKKLPVPWCRKKQDNKKKYTKSNNDDDTFHDIRFSTTTTIMIAIINVILFEICSVVRSRRESKEELESSAPLRARSDRLNFKMKF